MKHYVRRTLAILLAVMLLAALSIPAYAQGPRGNGQERGNGAGFVDADGDGVCDYFGTGRGNGQGVGFVDKDGDGVCDYFGTGCGSGQGRGQRNG